MLTITGYSVELIHDPFGILAGDRYEFLIDIEVPEDDDLYSENGLYIKVIYRVEESRLGIVNYEIFEKKTERYLDFEMDEEEEKLVEAFCKEHLQESGE
jgi:hypothetical protein